MGKTQQTSFVQKILAKLSGTSAEATAEKIAKKSISALEVQVANLKAKIVDDENKVSDAKELLEERIYLTEVPRENSLYCQNIVTQQQNVYNAEAELEATKKSYDYFNELLEKLR